MDIKQFVLDNVKPETYYKALYPTWNTLNHPNQICEWHEDENPSLAVGLNNGGAKCHACGKTLGNIVHFESQKENISELEASKKIYAQHYRKILDPRTIRVYSSNLQDKHKLWLREDCGLLPETISRFALGIEPSNRRIIIPIKDRFGNFTNIRHYQLPRHRNSGTKVKIYNETGYGYLELFPWQAILHYTSDKPVVMMKAEKDTMLAIQDGFQAFCVTNGELSWSEEWDNLFEGFDIAICLDQDETGRKAAEKKLARLQSPQQQLKILLSRLAVAVKNIKTMPTGESLTKANQASLKNYLKQIRKLRASL
jgi:DNA primase